MDPLTITTIVLIVLVLVLLVAGRIPASGAPRAIPIDPMGVLLAVVVILAVVWLIRIL